MAPQAGHGGLVAGQSMQAATLHQRRHGVVADMDAQAQTEPGVHPGEPWVLPEAVLMPTTASVGQGA